MGLLSHSIQKHSSRFQHIAHLCFTKFVCNIGPSFILQDDIRDELLSFLRGSTFSFNIKRIEMKMSLDLMDNEEE